MFFFYFTYKLGLKMSVKKKLNLRTYFGVYKKL